MRLAPTAPYFVHWDKQTGYLSGEPESPEGLPSLSLALLRVVADEFFMALVQSDEGGAYALVQVRDRAVQADGESVFTERDGGDRGVRTSALDGVRAVCDARARG